MFHPLPSTSSTHAYEHYLQQLQKRFENKSSGYHLHFQHQQQSRPVYGTLPSFSHEQFIRRCHETKQSAQEQLAKITAEQLFLSESRHSAEWQQHLTQYNQEITRLRELHAHEDHLFTPPHEMIPLTDELSPLEESKLIWNQFLTKDLSQQPQYIQRMIQINAERKQSARQLVLTQLPSDKEIPLDSKAYRFSAFHHTLKWTPMTTLVESQQQPQPQPPSSSLPLNDTQVMEHPAPPSPKRPRREEEQQQEPSSVVKRPYPLEEENTPSTKKSKKDPMTKLLSTAQHTIQKVADKIVKSGQKDTVTDELLVQYFYLTLKNKCGDDCPDTLLQELIQTHYPSATVVTQLREAMNKTKGENHSSTPSKKHHSIGNLYLQKSKRNKRITFHPTDTAGTHIFQSSADEEEESHEQQPSEEQQPYDYQSLELQEFDVNSLATIIL